MSRGAGSEGEGDPVLSPPGTDRAHRNVLMKKPVVSYHKEVMDILSGAGYHLRKQIQRDGQSHCVTGLEKKT